MDSKDFYKFSKPCIASGVTIYPKPSNYGKYKIIINRNGHEKTGDQVYEDTAIFKEESLKTPKGIVKVKVVVPSVWDKILELYKDICIKNKLLEQ